MGKLIQQMIKFGFVGVLCFFIDYGIMVFLTEVFGINYMVSSTVSFSVSVTVNYILSVAFVFETDKDKNKIPNPKNRPENTEIDASRLPTFSPDNPTKIADVIVNISIPVNGEIPAKTPNAAPENPISDNVCVKKEV